MSESTLAPFQLRVVSEKAELDDRIAKLTEFIDGPAFVLVDQVEQHRLIEQRGAMRAYSRILGERIENFKPGV